MGFGDSHESAPVRRFVPAWLRAPQGMFPGVLALELVLARTEKVAIAIPRVYGYPDGFEIELRVISGPDGAELDSRLYRAGLAGRLDLDDRGLPPPEMLRFAVEFADGSRVTNTTPFAKDFEVQPDGPVMHAQGGGGGAGNWRQFLWVWPLPPAGSLTFICEWPALQIPVTRQTLDAQDILDAAGRAEVLFPHEDLPLPPWPPDPEPHTPNQPFVF